MLLVRKCPICSCEEGEKIDELTFTNEKENCLPSRYNVVACKECGFTYADMEASQDLFDRYYAGLNIYSEAETLRKVNLDKTNPYFEYIYKVISKEIRSTSKIIDIGCGGGELLDYLSYKGLSHLTGMDPSKKSIDYLMQRGYEGICQSIFDDIKDENREKYDLVISTAVVEHVYDINMYVERLKQYVAKDGCIFLTAPAVEGFETFICKKANYFNQEHINYFSKNSLQNLFGKHGLILINKNCINESEEEKVLYMLFKKCDRAEEIVYDDISKTSITNYLLMNEKKEKELNDKINYILSTNKKIVIWGTGQYAKQIINKYPLIVDKLKYFIDSNTVKQGTHICEKEIVSSNQLNNEEDDIIICICSMKNANDIEKQIISEKISFEIMVL